MKIFQFGPLGLLLQTLSLSAPLSSLIVGSEKMPPVNHHSERIEQFSTFFTAGRRAKETKVKNKEDVHAAIVEIYSGGNPNSTLNVEESTSRAGLDITSGGTEIFEIVTTYDGGWKQDGVMFDIRTVSIGTIEDGAEGITILGFDVLTPVENEMVCVEVYTKKGSLTENGSEQSPDRWTFLGSVSVTGQGKNTPTHIPIGSFDPTYLGIDDTRAFYITTQDENLRYTALDGSEGGNVTGGVFSEEEHSFSKDDGSSSGFRVEILTGVAKNYPFDESWQNRVFNGAVIYRLGNNLDLSSIFSQMSGAAVQDSIAAKRGYATCDVDTTAVSAIGAPTSNPTQAPTREPTISPTPLPTVTLTTQPSYEPSLKPTSKPSKNPTMEPTIIPTQSPTPAVPTISPTPILRSVATTLSGGLKQAGLMFDVRVPSVENGGPEDGLTVIGFEVSTLLETELCVEVYTKSGTHVGFESDVTENDDGTWSSSSWTTIGAGATIGKGEGEPTLLPLGSTDPIFISPGDTRAFYVTMQTPDLRYTEPKFGEVTGDVFSSSSEGHMELLVGSAVSYAFLDSWPNRIFNGAVVYHLGGVLEPAEYGDITADQRTYTCNRPIPTGNNTEADETIPSANETRPEDPETNTTMPVGALDANATVPDDGRDNFTRPEDFLDGGSAKDEHGNATIPDGATENATSVETPASRPPALVSTNKTRAPTPLTIDSLEPTQSPQALTIIPRLVGKCLDHNYEAGTEDVVVGYEYELVTDSGVDVQQVVLDIENVIHGNLVAQKCSSNSVGQARTLQNFSNTSYLGFNSDPIDILSDAKCTISDSLADNEVCTLVLGGLTATIDGGDNTQVKDELNTFVGDILSDFNNVDETGATQITFVDSDNSEVAEAGNIIDTEFSEVQKGGEEAIESGRELSPGAVAGIAIGAVAAVAIVLLALATLRKRRKRKEKFESVKELFEDEMLDDEPVEELGQVGNARNQSTQPLYQNDEEFSQPPVAILNDHDEISLVSNAASKILVQPPPPESSVLVSDVGGSVEFVRAGQSFGSRSRSYQPEDTVDL
mmetsp:Transcript_15380/g.32367  ORF Transcript_15380/g.32367 Transcript_15380/m.32367 type:complete len:1055 (+) Transcript_15380:166-3330(+)